MEITCNIIKDLADAYLFSDISYDTAQAVLEHLDICPECRAYYDECMSYTEADEQEEEFQEKLSDDRLAENVRILSARLRKKRRITNIANAALLTAGAAMLSVGLAFLLNRSGNK